MSLAFKRYGPYDPGKVLVYLLNAIANEQAICIRTTNAFLIASRFVPTWWLHWECHVVFLCAESGAHWEAVRLLRRSVEWAKEHECRKWQFSSETKHGIGALAKRVGAVEISPPYKIDL